jgi:hypothetical protein
LGDLPGGLNDFEGVAYFESSLYIREAAESSVLKITDAL